MKCLTFFQVMLFSLLPALGAHAQEAAPQYGDLRAIPIESGDLAGTNLVETYEEGEEGDEWRLLVLPSDVAGNSLSEDGRPVYRREDLAKVVCRQLGFSGDQNSEMLRRDIDMPSEYQQHISERPNLPGGGGRHPTTGLDNLGCTGSEASLADCRFYEEKDAGVPQVHWASHSPVRPTDLFRCSESTNSTAVGELTVGGDPKEIGNTLTADHSGITDADGKPESEASYSYQWIREAFESHQKIINGEEVTAADYISDTRRSFDISGATEFATYVLGDNDKGTRIQVKVSFQDDAGNSEEVRSHPAPTGTKIGFNYKDGDLALLEGYVGQGSRPLRT